MRAIEQRLARLEQAVSPRETVHVWADDAETLVDTIAERWPEGVPDGVTLVVYRWRTDADQ